ncbi:MAG: acyl-CoA dehydrogenase family protein [Candidatus Omnitrophica bacterium]|nr:acyl-CoA dehydrogenase family protein [Candidatus Omnitrophota bacterium]
MDYFLTDEQKMVKELAQKIAQEKILPVRAECDEKEEFAWDVVKALAQSDLFGVYIPEEYGGMGFGIFELCLVIEELSKVCGGISLSYAGTALGTFPILLFGNEQQKKKYLPFIASGEKIAAFGVTESEAGSDITTLNTTAKKEGDYYVLNGTKQWITNGGEAEIYVVVAATDKTKGPRGLTAFILEKGMEGFGFGKKENKLGIRASATRELVFENCKVPAENVLAKEGMGFIITLKNFDASRPGVATQALGIAQGAFEAALEYSHQRKQFGQPISSFQAVQHILADMATQIEAARALIYQTAKMIDVGAKDYSANSAMCKLFASDVAMKVTTDAIQVFGGYGYMKEYPVEKMFRDAKITQIYEGTNQMQRNFIAHDLIKSVSKKK